MDRNQVIGLVVISAIFIVYLTFFAPETPEVESTENRVENTEGTDSSASEGNSENEEVAASESTSTESTYQDTTMADSLQNLVKASEYGIFAPAITESEETIKEISTPNLDLKFSSKGGKLIYAKLNEYKTYSKEPLVLLDKSSFSETISFVSQKDKKFNLADLDFSLNSITDSSVEMVANLAGNGKIIRQYKINQDKYLVSQKIKFEGLDEEIKTNSIVLRYDDTLKVLEKGVRQSRQRSLVNFLTDGSYDYEHFNGTSKESEEIENIGWFSFKQSYFTKGFIFNQPIKKITVSGISFEDDSSKLKYLAAKVPVPANQIMGPEGFVVTTFYGPNKYGLMAEIAPEFDQNVELGWSIFRGVNKYLFIPLFNFLESFISSYGLIILIMVIILKAALFPLTYKSYLGMAKMRVLKPEVDAINEKYADDKQKSQQESMKLYQEFGVNPVAGCIPMLFQMPILFAMFRLFPNLIQLRQQPFLWAEDLSAYDSLITWQGMDFFPLNFLDGHISLFTLLMTISTIGYSHFSNQMTTQTQPGMKLMTYAMPLMFFFILNSYSSGLTYYYFLSNLISIGQQVGIRRFVDEDKIREKLEKNKAKNKNKNKSSFQNQLSSALKKQQEKKKSKKK